jgi:hypothetical protein
VFACALASCALFSCATDGDENTTSYTSDVISGCSSTLSFTRVGDTAKAVGTLKCSSARSISATICVHEEDSSAPCPPGAPGWYCSELTTVNNLGCNTVKAPVPAGGSISASIAPALWSGTHTYTAEFYTYDTKHTSSDDWNDSSDQIWTK